MYQKKFHNGTDEISVRARPGIQCPNGYLHEKGGLMAYSIEWPACVILDGVLETGRSVRRQPGEY